MASKKRTTKKVTEPVEEKQVIVPVEEQEEKIQEEAPAIEVEEPKKTNKKKNTPVVEEKQPKHKIGSIVFISKDAEADLNGFKLFPQYKKYTYTVEAYDADRDVYILRRLNLSLKLQSAFILAPDERAHDPINRKQF